MSTCSNKTPEFLTGDLFARRATLSRLEPEQEYYVTEDNGKTYLYVGGLNGEAILVSSTDIDDVDNLQNELDIAQADLMVAGQTVPANTTLRAAGNDWYHPTGATAPDPLTETSLIAAGFIRSSRLKFASSLSDLKTFDRASIVRHVGHDYEFDSSDLSALMTFETQTVEGFDATADTLTITGHNWITGQAFVFDNPPSGFSANTKYYVGVIDADTFAVYTTASNAFRDVFRRDIPVEGVSGDLIKLLDPAGGTYAPRAVDSLRGDAGAFRRKTQDGFYNVELFGASRTAGDNHAAFNDAIQYLVKTGGTLDIPDGEWDISWGLVADETNETSHRGKRMGVRGRGRSATTLAFGNGDFTGISFLGGSGAGQESHVELEGFFVDKRDLVGVGIFADNLAFLDVARVRCRGWQYGSRFTDILSTRFASVIWRNNKYGFEIDHLLGSKPNAINLVSCVIGNNEEWGAKVTRGASFVMTGGSIESNGNAGAELERFGIYFKDCGDQGSTGFDMSGVYMENNNPDQDVIIEQTLTNEITYNFHGCSFKKISNATDGGASGSAPRYPENHVLLKGTAGIGRVNFFGTGFSSTGGYVPGSGRPIVKIDTGAEDYFKVTDFGCHIQNAVEIPESTVMSRISSDTLPFAQGRLDTSAGIWFNRDDGFASSITKVGTGRFNVTFSRPQPDSNYLADFTILGATGGVVQLNNATTTSCQFRVEDMAGADADIDFIVSLRRYL